MAVAKETKEQTIKKKKTKCDNTNLGEIKDADGNVILWCWNETYACNFNLFLNYVIVWLV